MGLEGAFIPLIIRPVQLPFEFLTNLQPAFGSLQFLHFGLELTFHLFLSFVGDGLAEGFSHLLRSGTLDPFLICSAKDLIELPVIEALTKGSSSQFEDGAGVFLLLLDGVQPDVEGFGVEGGAAKGEKESVFLGLGGSGDRLLGIGGGRRGDCFPRFTYCLNTLCSGPCVKLSASSAEKSTTLLQPTGKVVGRRTARIQYCKSGAMS